MPLMKLNGKRIHVFDKKWDKSIVVCSEMKMKAIIITKYHTTKSFQIIHQALLIKKIA